MPSGDESTATKSPYHFYLVTTQPVLDSNKKPV
jgi:hypothetical protein